MYNTKDEMESNYYSTEYRRGDPISRLHRIFVSILYFSFLVTSFGDHFFSQKRLLDSKKAYFDLKENKKASHTQARLTDAAWGYY